MRKPFFKTTMAALMLVFLMASCGPTLKITQAPLSKDVSNSPEKKAKLSLDQQKEWPKMDMQTDTVPGMSVRKTYEDIIKDQKGEPVIVAVLDAGVDIAHEDLKNVIWTNKGEIPNNGVDDDHNGYVDDVHGWNFLGDEVHAELEYTRFVRRFSPRFKGKSKDEISPDNLKDYKIYKRAKKKLHKELSQAKMQKNAFESNVSFIKKALNNVKEEMNGFDFSKEELKNKKSDDSDFNQSKGVVLAIMSRANLEDGKKLKKVENQINEGEKYFSSKIKYHLNVDFVGRKKVGDDVNDITDTDYGDNRVMGPTKDKEDVMHGTHVAGIIAAERNNGIGMNGVANNVEIMPIRAVPDGDEFDKDIALGIRYAVDNGAKVINMSFGKYFSAHPDWVVDAMKYAAKHDVLMVKAAGNESFDLDTIRTYPNDQWPGQKAEVVNSMIVVGALNDHYGEDLPAPFSDYGISSVDVFAPGMQIWSTVPNNKYKFLQGTSMAAPEVAGVAAMIRSYFPKLTAAQVKKCIMNSGLTSDIEVEVPHDRTHRTENPTKKPFDELSKSGRMVNLYNAMILASKMAK